MKKSIVVQMIVFYIGVEEKIKMSVTSVKPHDGRIRIENYQINSYVIALSYQGYVECTSYIE